MIIDAILKAGVAAGVRARQALQNDRTAARQDQAVPDKQPPALAEGHAIIILADDKAFDANWIVEELSQRGAKVVISQRKNRIAPLEIDKEMYKWRRLIENFFRKFK